MLAELGFSPRRVTPLGALRPLPTRPSQACHPALVMLLVCGLDGAA